MRIHILASNEWCGKVFRTIGVKACGPETPGAYPVRKAPKQNSWFVSLQALLGYHNLKVKGTRRYPVSVNDGVFIVNLTDNLEEH